MATVIYTAKDDLVGYNIVPAGAAFAPAVLLGAAWAAPQILRVTAAAGRAFGLWRPVR